MATEVVARPSTPRASGPVGRGATRLAVAVLGTLVGTRIGTAAGRPVGRAGRALAPVWAWFLAGSVAGYLGRVPGMPLASALGVANEGLVIGLAAFAFATFGLALWAARAQDRLQAVED